MRTRRVILLILAFGWALTALIAGPAPPGRAAEDVRPIHLIRIEGPISPGSAGFLTGSLDKAIEAGAQALIVELDTPGGLADSMRTMVKAIMNAPLPVIVYVAPTGAQAASAGVMVTMAADVAVMAPGTNIGAAHPVATGGQEIEGTMAEKVVNDMVAFIQGIARQRGRNMDWAKKAVEKSVSINSTEAVLIDVVDFLAENRQDLLKKLDGRRIERGSLSFTLRTDGAALVVVEEGLRDRVLKTLANPNLAYILMMLGLAGLYFELSHPGAVLPGVVGGISLILAFYSFQTLPVNYAGLLLILLGLILFILEIKITSYGMLSVGGLISLTLGSLMLFDTPEQYMMVSLAILIPVLGTVALFFIVVTWLVVRSQVPASISGPSGLIGLRGPVKEWRDGRGKVLVHGEWWSAEGEPDLSPGEEIEVLEVRGMRLRVRRLARLEDAR
ncbi:MAG: nodulation protein NfeD [Proteobacteria bacterium]|nr:nodulation protein NfeD [Pseudomonadota bacterium]